MHDHRDHDDHHASGHAAACSGQDHGYGQACCVSADDSTDVAFDAAGDALAFRVTGMDCASCATTIRTALERLPGVSGVRVSVPRERLVLSLDEVRTTPSRIVEAVAELGYRAEPVEEGAVVKPARPAAWWRTAKGLHAIGGGIATAAAFLVDALAPEAGEWLFAMVALLLAIPVARRAFAAARLGAPFTIEMLMTIAVIGAVIIGEAAEAAVVVFLFATGEVLEAYAAGRARAGIQGLAALVPDRVVIEENGSLREIPASAIRPGHVVLVRPGDRVAADGTIVEGIAHLDEVAITGESMPVSRGPGDSVFAGSMALDAVLKVRAESGASDNMIARIVALVEEAQDAKAPAERFIDSFSRVYTPLVVALAVLVAVIPPLAFGGEWQTWIYRALALLLIGCPCALVISVPAAVASALSSAAHAGILVKGGVILETLAKTDLIAFDKTGTLTEGRPVVTSVVARDGDPDRLLALAAAVEAGSNHPLAEAILREAEARRAGGLSAGGVRALAGRGVTGTVEGQTVFIGAPRFAKEEGRLDTALADAIAGFEAAGNTVAVIVVDGEAAGVVALRDEPRADAAGAMAELRRDGIETVMLSGDNAVTAAAIGKKLGIATVRGGMLPADKVEALKAMSAGRHSVMVGDGINDAAALAAAGVGIAMGSGTGLAQETAGVALIGNRVADVVRLTRLARATMANIRQNVAIALGLKAVFLVTTVFGVTGLWIAVFADTGATVLVTLNAMRLLLPSAGK